ncbi:hypothetical protein E4T56_gene3802, partial [Termitomyces sp. T112]
APGFFTHGAKLLLAGGDHAKVSPETIRARLADVGVGVHHTPVTAISITQASEAGCAYTPAQVAAIGALAREKGLRFHMDGARFANAVAHLGCSPAAASVEGGVEALSFGFVKNGGMSAEALVFFAPDMIEATRYRRKRAGHLQSKGRYLAAQILAMLKGDLWLANARHANAAAGEIAAAAGDRLIHPVEANEVFVALSAAERAVLRGAGFAFYDWDETAARFVTAWNSPQEEVMALAKALRGLPPAKRNADSNGSARVMTLAFSPLFFLLPNPAQPHAIIGKHRLPPQNPLGLAVRHPPVLGIEGARGGGRVLFGQQGGQGEAGDPAGFLDHGVLGRGQVVGDVIGAGRGGQGGVGGPGDILDMDAAEDLARQVYAVGAPLRQAVEGGPSRPIDSRQAQHSCAQFQPCRIGLCARGAAA